MAALFNRIEVLLVEDELPVANLLMEVLKGEPPSPNWPLTYRIQHADTLKRALRYASGGGWDIIILDLSLPDSQGVDTFKAVYAVAKAPIFVFTGSVDYTVKDELRSLGAAKVYGKTELMGCLGIIHQIIDNAIDDKKQRDKINQLEQARLNILRSLEYACPECGRWRTPDTGEWFSPDKFLEKYEIYLSHTICPEDQIKLYGHLREENES